MDIKEAAKKLKLSERHLRRLITTGQIPARKIKKLVEVEVWDIPDEVAQAANDAFTEMCKYENFGEWMLKKLKDNHMSLTILSKRTRLPMEVLIDIARTPGYLSAENTNVEEKIGKILLRAEIERRCKNV